MQSICYCESVRGVLRRTTIQTIDIFQSIALFMRTRERILTGREGSEHSLVRALARGDETAASELVRVYGDPVLRFVYRRVEEQTEDAEEITLDTFASAVRLAASYDQRSSVFTWLCGIAKLRIIDFYRRVNRAKRRPAGEVANFEFIGESSPEPFSALDQVEAKLVVDELLMSLSNDEREALLLRYVEQLSVREISTLMGRSEKGVEGLLTRAKIKPREAVIRFMQGGSE